MCGSDPSYRCYDQVAKYLMARLKDYLRRVAERKAECGTVWDVIGTGAGVGGLVRWAGGGWAGVGGFGVAWMDGWKRRAAETRFGDNDTESHGRNSTKI